MRRFARIWLNLTRLALLAGCSGQLPLEVPDRAPLPVEFAGSGAVGMWSGGTQHSGSAAVCGDAVIQSPQEACDRTNLNGATCANLGFAGGGVLRCNLTTCFYDTIMCRMTVNQGGVAGQGGEVGGQGGAVGGQGGVAGRPGVRWPIVSEADAGTEDAG